MNNQRRSVSVFLVLFCALAVGAALLLSSSASAQSSRAWTSAGSTGTVDEDSTAITQVDGISRFCPATTSQVRVRFRNGDNSGATAKTSFDIHSSNITGGGNNI